MIPSGSKEAVLEALVETTMTTEKLLVVRRFDCSGKRLVTGCALDLRSADDAVEPTRRAAKMAVAVIAVGNMFDTDIGKVP